MHKLRKINKQDFALLKVVNCLFSLQGSLKYFEEELVSCFSEDPDVVLVSLLPSRYT